MMRWRDPEPTRAKELPGRHLLIYDDDCGFCVASVRFIQAHAREPLELLPFSALPAPDVLEGWASDDVRGCMHFVTPDGCEYHCGQALTRALRLLPAGQLASVLDLPGLSSIRAAGYALVARNRFRISKWMGLDACVMPPSPVDGEQSSGPRQRGEPGATSERT